MSTNHQAFSRSIALRMAIIAITQQFINPLEAYFKIQGLGEYKSRGHGGKHKASRSRPNLDSGHSSVNPHQGVRECARRLRYPCPSVPRQMWVSGPGAFCNQVVSSTRRVAAKFNESNGYGYCAVLQ